VIWSSPVLGCDRAFDPAMASNQGSAMAAPTPWSRVLRDNVPSAMLEKE
jgi:hypothetical protein